MKRALLLAAVAVIAISGCGKKREDNNTGSAPAPVVDNHRHVLAGKDIAFVKNQLEQLTNSLTAEEGLASIEENKTEVAAITAELTPVSEALTALYKEVLGENEVDETKEYSVKHEQDEAFEANAEKLEALVIRFNKLKGHAEDDSTRILVKPAPVVEPVDAPAAGAGAPAGEAPAAETQKPLQQDNQNQEAPQKKTDENGDKPAAKPAAEKTDGEAEKKDEKKDESKDEKKDGEAPAKTDDSKSDETSN